MVEKKLVLKAEIMTDCVDMLDHEDLSKRH